ncbi:hypothetical protein BDR06DRAFT_961405 [Suillus hirtellus]|nr:hypothetical protein BDR06DRAFT_961405 [Suillus hirtellus]
MQYEHFPVVICGSNHTPAPQTFKDEVTIGLWHKICVLNNRIATQILSENITQRDKKGKGEACQDAGVSIMVVCYVLPISLLLLADTQPEQP